MKTTLLSINNQYALFCDKFINLLMYDGKKLKASKTFFLMLQNLRKKLQNQINDETTFVKEIDLIDYVLKSIENVKPTLEVKKVRVAGNTYLVPSILSKKKQQNLAIRWIIDAARKRKKNSHLKFAQCLTEEIVEAFKQQGNARQKRDELHRLAETNRAYIRYRWW